MQIAELANHDLSLYFAYFPHSFSEKRIVLVNPIGMCWKSCVFLRAPLLPMKKRISLKIWCFSITSPYDLLNVCCVFMLLLEMLAFLQEILRFCEPPCFQRKNAFPWTSDVFLLPLLMICLGCVVFHVFAWNACFLQEILRFCAPPYFQSKIAFPWKHCCF